MRLLLSLCAGYAPTPLRADDNDDLALSGGAAPQSPRLLHAAPAPAAASSSGVTANTTTNASTSTSLAETAASGLLSLSTTLANAATSSVRRDT
jgi:hypothetical protein